MPSNSKTPLISVLMPVYNAELYLKQALNSILEQTFTNFEIIAIDDGSTDKSGEILEQYAQRDGRVRVFSQKNSGIVATLNRAIDESRGLYLARQDSDDISFPKRFEYQSTMLENESDIVLVSGGFEVFDQEDEFLYREVIPSDDQDIKRAMYLRNPIGHGSVMFRKSALEVTGNYSSECGPTEDFELWIRLAKVGKFAAVEQAVFHWRVNSTGITSTQNKSVIDISKAHISGLWGNNLPPRMSSKQLRNKGLYYYRTYPKRGVDMKNIMLADNAQIAIKLMSRGHFLKGLSQLFAVMLVGRSGLRVVYHRLHVVRKGSIDLIRKRAKFGRQDPA